MPMSYPLSWEVKAHIAVQFPQAIQAQAAEALEQYQSSEANRVRLAALALAQDDLAELRLIIQEAQRDYRDVLTAMEVLASQHPRRANWQQPSIDAVVGPSGWLTCPGCGRRFSLSNARSWNGQRHRSCGQQINPVPISEPPVV